MKKIRYTLFFLLLVNTCLFAQEQKQKKEVYQLDWLKDKSWHQIQDNDMPAFTVQLYTPPKETMENWTLLGNTTFYKNVEEMPLDTLMHKMFYQTNVLYPTAKLRFIEKSEKENWILFAIDVPEETIEKSADSQILHLTKGNGTIYSSIITAKKRFFTEAETKKFTQFLRKSKLLYQ